MIRSLVNISHSVLWVNYYATSIQHHPLTIKYRDLQISSFFHHCLWQNILLVPMLSCDTIKEDGSINIVPQPLKNIVVILCDNCHVPLKWQHIIMQEEKLPFHIREHLNMIMLTQILFIAISIYVVHINCAST
ncbi:hypothetical protein ACJX0J_008795 [Zea mays]